ncbi:MAG: ABC transporter permease [Lachnospiraceae bacterium]|nr:ABC transporter permease [Lachnospiraceae bacterium]
MDKLSAAQKNFLAARKRHHTLVNVCRASLLLGFFLIWEIAARVGWINDFIFSSPARVLACFIEMAANGSIFLHIAATLSETLISFFAVMAAGIAVALLLWRSRGAAEVLEPYLVTLNSLPKSALAPVLIVWLGSNVRTIIVTAASVAVFGSILTLYTGFQEVDEDKIKLIRTLGGTKKDIMTKVLIPHAVPLIISNMKVNVGLCLVGVIIGEFLAANQGLGYLIIYGSQTFRMDWVILSILILCLGAVFLYWLLNLLEQYYTRHFFG